MIQAILNFIWGYLIIELKGNALERLLNRFSSSGIRLWDIQRIKQGFRFKMMAKDFYRLRPLVRYRKCTARIYAKKGLPFLLYRSIHRKALFVGVVVFFVILKVLASFLWFVQIRGLEEIPREEIQQYLDAKGIHPGMLLKRIDVSGLERLILANHPRVAWVDAHVRGTQLTLTVVEKTILEKSNLTDIIASRPAVITQLIVFKGKALVKEGDTVNTGDTLIQASNKYTAFADPDLEGNLPPYLPPADEPIEPAKGIVKGRVWYEGYGEAPIILTDERLTGRKERAVKIKIGPQILHFSGPKKVGYEHYRVEKEVKSVCLWRNITLPIEIITEEYQETVILRETRTPEMAMVLAKDQATNAILNSLSSNAIIIQTKSFLIEDGDSENNIVRVKVSIEVEENIAEPLPMEMKEEG